MFRKPIAVVLIASLAAGGAQAALLTNVQGMVTVNHGYGYEPAGVGGPVGPGDRVHVGEGSADIVYENGSTVNVRSGQTVIVQSTAPANTVGSQTPDINDLCRRRDVGCRWRCRCNRVFGTQERRCRWNSKARQGC